MFRRCILLFVVASLAVSGGPCLGDEHLRQHQLLQPQWHDRPYRPSPPASARSAPAGAFPWRRRRPPMPTITTCATIPAARPGPLTRMASALSYSGATYSHAVGSNMNDQGDFTSTVFQATPRCSGSRRTRARPPLMTRTPPRAADSKSAASGSTKMTTSAACTLGRPTTSGAYPYISMNNGGGSFTTYTPTSNYDSWVTAMTTPTTAGGLPPDMAAGFGQSRQSAAGSSGGLDLLDHRRRHDFERYGSDGGDGLRTAVRRLSQRHGRERHRD